MSHGPEHQIEQAEHAAHASHDTFNKNVTMSIAIVAAVLACVSMLGHRAHNETLRLQGEALSLQAEASISSTRSANEWAYYQTKNIFNLESEIALDFLKFAAVKEDQQKDYQEMVKRYEGSVAYYSGSKDHRTTKSAGSTETEKKAAGKLAKIEENAKKLAAATRKLEEAAEEKIKESHLEHMRASRLDYGELGLQFAVVLCSLAILMKNRSFWFGGIVSGAVGAAVAATGQFGLFMAHH